MCNGIAILIWEKDNKIKGLCTGISSHDELAKLDYDLRYGNIEPYRFELLYPCNLVYDRSVLPLSTGINNEQPPYIIWEKAYEYVKIYMLKHTKEQLQYATLINTNLEKVHLKNANLENAHLENANLKNAHLENANLKNANLENANLKNAHLEFAHLENAHLEYANLEFANLENANLENANLKNAHLENANLGNAHFIGTILEK